MNFPLEHIAPALILLFLAITFLQSGIDKITDWSGNLGWFKGHFEKTFLGGMAGFNLGIILVLEVVSGFACAAGMVLLLWKGDKGLGFGGAALAGLTCCLLLFGQRLAKDYVGAAGIVPYFIVAVLGIFLLA